MDLMEPPPARAYRPRPIDTSGVTLSDDLKRLAGRLAVGMHEYWAAARTEQGWAYGPHQDDRARTHPCLVPFDRMSEQGQDFDRRSAAEAIKLLLALGYRIEKA